MECNGCGHGQEHARAVARSGIQTVHERSRAVDQATHNKIVSFIWGIADDVLRDLFRRGKYPDVILPMCVLRRMYAVLEPTKQAVLDAKRMLHDARITEQRAALADAARQAFYNTSRFTLRDLKSRGNHQQLLGLEAAARAVTLVRPIGRRLATWLPGQPGLCLQDSRNRLQHG